MVASPHHGLKYEDMLTRLEKLVGELEGPELDLETRFKKFEDALKILGVLTEKLEQGKKKVEVLVHTHLGQTELAPFDDDRTENEEPPDDEEPTS